MLARDTVERKSAEAKSATKLGDDLIRIKKAEAQAAHKIEAMERKMEVDIQKTERSLNEKKKTEIARERSSLIEKDKKLQKEIDAESLEIEKEGKKEMVDLRGKVENRVAGAAEEIFRSVLHELEKE